MKTLPTICFLLLTLLAGCTDSYRKNTHLLLDRQWKFKPADDLEFAHREYDDSDWSPIKIGTPWQKQGYDYVGFAWYRIKIFIPSSLEEQVKSDSIKIFLGGILDAHQVFLNGVIVGENGKTVNGRHRTDSAFLFQPLSAGHQKYVLPIHDSRIQWDKENLLAVRVFNRKNNGGFMLGIPYIGLTALEDYIGYNNEAFYKPDSQGIVDTNLIITNFFNKPINGDLFLTGRIIESGRQVLDVIVPIQLQPGESKSIPVSLPMTLDQTKLGLLFEEQNLKEAVQDSLIIPFVLVR